jgi:hypothetical protein
VTVTEVTTTTTDDDGVRMKCTKYYTTYDTSMSTSPVHMLPKKGPRTTPVGKSPRLESRPVLHGSSKGPIKNLIEKLKSPEIRERVTPIRRPRPTRRISRPEVRPPRAPGQEKGPRTTPVGKSPRLESRPVLHGSSKGPIKNLVEKLKSREIKPRPTRKISRPAVRPPRAPGQAGVPDKTTKTGRKNNEKDTNSANIKVSNHGSRNGRGLKSKIMHVLSARLKKKAKSRALRFHRL